MLIDPNTNWGAVAGRASISAAACWTLYSVAVYVYRLTLHPLARYPGPKFAAASYLYEFWYDVVLDARYTDEIERLHKKYGKHLGASCCDGENLRLTKHDFPARSPDPNQPTRAALQRPKLCRCLIPAGGQPQT